MRRRGRRGVQKRASQPKPAKWTNVNVNVMVNVNVNAIGKPNKLQIALKISKQRTKEKAGCGPWTWDAAEPETVGNSRMNLGPSTYGMAWTLDTPQKQPLFHGYSVLSTFFAFTVKVEPQSLQRCRNDQRRPLAQLWPTTPCLSHQKTNFIGKQLKKEEEEQTLDWS
ncbi:GL24227 [Drosophila persimilis]|uniref:GL24227 n=1 Tax=Drosophila persimilis TaxID=7234 RepID=B4G4R7_DROPE|nr:GL24227 [Drosophila persimilis]